MVKFILDGKQVEAEAGKTILEVATASGVKIPTLCYYKALTPWGGCRLCIVEIAGGRMEMAPSCTYPVEEGIQVQTNSPRVQKARQLVAGLLYLRCPEVPRIQELAREFGVTDEPWVKRFKPKNEDCVLCGLCTRICKERMQVNAIDFIGRGPSRKVGAPYGRPSPVCVTCGACETVCPLGTFKLSKVTTHEPRPLLSDYDADLVQRGSIYIPFAQAVPKVPVIDRQTCQYFGRNVCQTCEEFCEAKAINYKQEDELTNIDVGAVVLATGYDIIDPGLKKELGYGRFDNVVSSLQYERMLSASGPNMGTVLRPSDHKPPKKIAYIQCVGSREIDRNYCSSVCCMYATKEAIITREHAPETECTIFYIDLRAFGKGYEHYFQRAKELGVRYVRCRPSSVREMPETKNLALRFEKEDGSLVNEEFDLVVLSAGMKPGDETRKLTDILGIVTDKYGFARIGEMTPAETSRTGIYAAGVLTGPKDIPESVMEASAAASKAMSLLAEARGTLIKEKTYPPERDVTGQEPRIGVFVCHCGRNIAGVVDVKDVVAYASTLPNVVHAEDNVYTCSTDSCERIKKMIIEHDLNRVIVASCTPRTHEPLFRDTVRQVGLNPYLFEMANIRDQCSWVHMHEPQKATKKAKDLVRIAVAKSRLLEPLYPDYVDVNPRGLVLGGGLAGMTAALELAKQGFETYLLEKSEKLGGNLRRVRFLLDHVSPQEKLNFLIGEVKNHPKLHIFMNTEVVDFEGSAGNFKTTFTASGETHEIKHGAVIVATGAREYQGTEYLYGQHPGVISQLELEEKLASGAFNAKSVVMLQCVGPCSKPDGYCSRICCGQAIKTALRIKETKPDTSVFIIQNDMRTYGFNEVYYREARDKGVRFIRLAESTLPEVQPSNGKVRISLIDNMLKSRLHIDTDMLVLSTGIVPDESNQALAQKLKLPLTQEGFFLEAHLKLRPVDFASEGIFLCGLAHSPKTADESITQAMAAAARAATILSKPRIELQAAISNVVEENCDGCAYCVDPCPYKAISLIEYMKDGEIKKTVDADPAKCQGCGVCQATCPKQGIFIRNFKVDQLAAMVEAALAE
ncbi:MAG: FAD-dependent oxidoreductase [Dehalococcoidales bacterium]